MVDKLVLTHFLCLFLSSVVPQEIQPGDHHKALLGRKVSVQHHILHVFSSNLGVTSHQETSSSRMQMQNNGLFFLCQTAKSHICFCHAEVFCSQSALVTFRVFGLKQGGVVQTHSSVSATVSL